MNKVILIGRLTRDAEVRYNGDNAYARFTLAVNRRVARNADGQQTADFISCVAFGKRAEMLEKYGKKGTAFAVEGRIQTGSYKNKDGNTVYTSDVAVDNLEFTESKKSSEAPAQAAPAQTSDDGFMYVPEGADDSLPFN